MIGKQISCKFKGGNRSHPEYLASMIVIQLTVGKCEVTTKPIRLFVNNTK